MSSGSVMATHGPLARSVRDLRAVFAAMTSEADPTDPLWTSGPDTAGLPALSKRVALVIDDGLPMDECARHSITQVGSWLENAGYGVDITVIPRFSDLFRMWKRIGAKDVVNGLGPILGALNDTGLTEVFSDWIPSFPSATDEDHAKALRDRQEIRAVWETVFDSTPMVVVPAFCSRAMDHSEDRAGPYAMASLEERARWQLNLPALGFPVIAVPTGMDAGAPQGVQIVAPSFREDVLFQAAQAIEEQRGPVAVVDPMW